MTAKHIMARYAEGKPATEDARCLACHTNPALAEPGPPSDPHVLSLRQEGVSCEACHGNAGGWIREHTSWTGDRTEAYATKGMVPLFDIGERAKNCLGCHVGAPEDKARNLPVRDMNHDMIAAGHPRLNFDFAEYLHRLPPHWQEKDRTSKAEVPPARPLNAAKAWLVGRAAHAETACRLLASRAERAMRSDERTPWPEFAEYNCAACHHNLRVGTQNAPNWRQNPEYFDGRPAGAAPWQMIWPMTSAFGIEEPKRLESRLKDVVRKMESARTPKPDAVDPVATKTASELQALRQTLAAMSDEEVIKQASVFFPGKAPGVPEWDSATQLFYGLAALERGQLGPPRAVPPAFRQARDAFRANDWPRVAMALDEIR